MNDKFAGEQKRTLFGATGRVDGMKTSTAITDEPTAPTQQREVMRAEEVAAFLGIGRRQVFEAVARGELPHRRVGRRVLFHRGALLEWLGAASHRHGKGDGDARLP
jgi:excisionase family DNA binding protein